MNEISAYDHPLVEVARFLTDDSLDTGDSALRRLWFGGANALIRLARRDLIRSGRRGWETGQYRVVWNASLSMRRGYRRLTWREMVSVADFLEDDSHFHVDRTISLPDGTHPFSEPGLNDLRAAKALREEARLLRRKTRKRQR